MFIVYCIGFSFLKELRNLPIPEKLGAAIMFGLGFVGIVVSALAYWTPATNFAAFSYRSTEQATLIIIACIPSLKFLVNRIIGKQKAKSNSSTKTILSHYKPSFASDKGGSHLSDDIGAKYDLEFNTVTVSAD